MKITKPQFQVAAFGVFLMEMVEGTLPMFFLIQLRIMVETILNGSLYCRFRFDEAVGLDRIRGGVHLADSLS